MESNEESASSESENTSHVISNETEIYAISTGNTGAVSSMHCPHRRGRVAALDRLLPTKGATKDKSLQISGSKCLLGKQTISRARKVRTHIGNKHRGLSPGTLLLHGVNTATIVFRVDSVC